ncbi:MAG: hypothetical protein GXO04_01195, partial [Aquificae bacterium]|nr:hypothetical protein [Aquificota bacterium]
LYFFRARELDRLRFFEEILNYHELELYLSLGNYTDARKIHERVKNELFYNPLYRISYMNYWLYPDFLRLLGKRENYYGNVLKLGWLSLGKKSAGFALLALYNKALSKLPLSGEEKEFIRLVRLREGEFILLGEVFSFERQRRALEEKLSSLSPRADAPLVVSLYKLSPKNFLKVFKGESSLYVLAEALVVSGDDEFLRVERLLPPSALSDFLRGKFWFLKGKREVAKRLLSRSLPKLEGIRRLEATLLLYYITENTHIDEVLALAEEYPELSGYFPYIYRLAGDIYAKKGIKRKAIEMYKNFLQRYKEKDEIYALTLFLLAKQAEEAGDKRALSYALGEARSFQNLITDAILTIWGES